MAVTTTVEARYIAETQQYVRRVQAAIDATNQFAQAFPQVEQSQAKVKTSTIALGTALGTLGAQMFARATGAIKKYATQGIMAAAQYEQTVISIQGIFAGSGMAMEAAAAKTQSYLGELRDFAARTPFELPQTLDAVKRLLSIGYAADDVKNRMLPAIGDIVAALGQPPQSISAVVYAFGQMKSAGRVLGQDLMQIGNALPGFNAKMALVKEMFGGDMVAATKAFESGAVDSAKAIDVLITAMTKFGGAAGAMDRQSKSLNGVISTFKDTVNNALIDGLMPAIPGLSAALTELMPVVETLATSFAQNLGPTLTSLVEAFAQVAPTIATALPPFLNLISAASKVAPTIQALAPITEMLARGMSLLAEALNAVPLPVAVAIAAVVLLNKALAKLSIESKVSTTSIQAGFSSMARSIKAEAAALGATTTATQRVLVGVGATSTVMAAKVKASFAAMGTAAKGFMASIGPIGWAIGIAGAAFEIFSGQQANAASWMDTLKASAEETTGALTEMSVAAIEAKLRADLSSEDQRFLMGIGASVTQMARALVEGGDAIDEVRAKLVAAKDAADGWGVGAGAATESLETMIENFDGAAGYVADYHAQLAVLEDEAMVTSANIDRMTDSAAKAAAGHARATQAIDTMSDSMRAAQGQSKMVEYRNTLIAKTAQIAGEAFTAMETAFTRLDERLSDFGSRDAALRSINDLNDANFRGEKALRGSSKAALENRNSVLQSAQAWVNYAQSAKDPATQQERLEKGIKRISKELRAKNIDPKNNEVVKTLQAQLDKSKEAVDKWRTQKQTAKSAGLDVGRGFIDGVIEGLKQKQPEGNAAAYLSGAALGNQFEQGSGVNSPSTYGIAVGHGHIEGAVLGLRAAANKGKQAARAIGAGIGKALTEALVDGQAVGDQFSKVFGSLPSVPSLLESLLGEKASGKWLEGKQKEMTALATAAEALGEIGQKIREIDDQIATLNDNRQSFAAYAQGRFGEPSEFSALVQSARDGSMAVSDILAAHDRIAEAIRATGEFSNGQLDQNTETLLAALEVSTRRLIGLAQQREELAKRLSYAQEAIAAATEVQSALNGLIGEPLGTRSDLSKALDSLTVTADTVVSKFEEIRKIFEDRMRSEALTLVARGDYAADEAGLAAAMKSRRAVYEARVAALEAQSRRLVALTAERDKIAKQMAEADSRLDDVLQKRNQMAEEIRSSLAGFLRLDSNLTDPAAFAEALKARVKAMAQFVSDIEQIRARGGSQGLLDTLMGMGAEQGGALAAGLATGNVAAIAEISALYEQANGLAEGYGAFSADRMYGAAVDQATAYANGLKAQHAAVVAEMDSIAAGIEETLRVMATDTGIGGVFAAQMLAVGLRDQYDTVTGEMAAITQGMADTLFPLIEQSFDMGQTMMMNLRRGLRAQARGLIDEVEAIANAMLEAMSKATGRPFERISIDRSFLRTPISMMAAPALDPRLFTAAAYPALGGSVGAANNILNVTVPSTIADPRAVGQAVVEAITAWEQANGPLFTRVQTP